jgi:hypothetical protein
MTWLASLRLGNRCANGLKFFKWSMTASGTDEISGMPMKHGALHKDEHGGTRQRGACDLFDRAVRMVWHGSGAHQ